MNQPTTKIHDLVEMLAKEGRNKILIPLIIKTAIAKAPWLAVPVVNPIFVWAISKLVDVFYDEAVLATFFGITNFQVGKQKDAYLEAVTQLEVTLTKHEGDLENEEVKKASEEFDKKLANLISFDL